MKYAIDRIIEGVAVLEDISSGDIIEVGIKKLPSGVREGSIVIFENGVYILDMMEEISRKESIRERLEKLKNLKK